MIDFELKTSKILYDFNKIPIIKERVNLKKKSHDTHKNSIFEYNFNDYGYRASFDYESLLTSEKIVCIGCSFTEGVGLVESEIWPFLLSQKVNLPFINLGIGGASDGYIMWQLMNVINTIQSTNIYVLLPPISRSFFLNDNYFNNIHSMSLLTENDSFERLFEYQRFLLINICDHYNIKYIKWNKFGTDFPKASDNQHFGCDYQTKISNEFLKL